LTPINKGPRTGIMMIAQDFFKNSRNQYLLMMKKRLVQGKKWIYKITKEFILVKILIKNTLIHNLELTLSTPTCAPVSNK
jgi:hypothetical protein